jgi:hypothetical protein
MTDPEYITVKEFSERAGLTPQYVYRLLTKKLAPYVTMVNEQKMIHIDGLLLFDSPSEPEDVEKQDNTKLESALQAQIDLLTAQLSIKDDQLANKDRQIANLDERLKEAHVLAREAQEKIPLLAAPEPEPPDPPQTSPPSDTDPTNTTESDTAKPPAKPSWLRKIFHRHGTT